MRRKPMAAAVGGVAMLFALLPAPASAQVDERNGSPAQSSASTEDDRPVAPISPSRGAPAIPEDPEAPTDPATRDAEREAELESEPEPDQVVVTFRDDVVRPNSVDGEVVETVPETPYATVDVPEGKTADQVADELEARGDVESAEPDRQVQAFESLGQQGEFERIGVQQAWKRATGSPDVIVAVVDSGIDSDHPDFLGRLVTGKDYVNEGTYPEDSDGHGTQTAGVIAAGHGGGTGIDGVAGAGTKIMPLRVLDGGTGSLSHVASAIRYAADNGADIVNLSLGAVGRSPTVDNAVAYAIDRGLVVVASAGNNGRFESNSPANSPGAIGVSATDDNGDTVAFTTFGPDVDLAAPGVAISTTANGGGSTSVNGTSFSAPLVAGVAALLKDRHPSWSGDRIVTELLLTAEDRGPTGIDDYYGYGLVDAAAALGVSGRSPFVGVAPAAVDAEPNDASAFATAATTTNTGSIGVEGDVDWWRFDSPGGEEVTITVDPVGDSYSCSPYPPAVPILDAVVSLHAPIGSPIAVVDDTCDGGTETITIATTPGTYRFSVANYRGTVGPGGYTVTVARTPTTTPPTSWDPTKREWLRSTTPVSRATNVSRTANLTVLTNRVLMGLSVDVNTVVLVDGVYGSRVPASVNVSGSEIFVNPSSSLEPGRPYSLILAGVEDAFGNVMPWTTIPFSTSGSFADPVVNGTYDPIVGDFSGDGATDVLYYAPGATADYLYLGDWSGMFDAGPFPVSGTYEPFTLDLDGNGYDDIIFYAPGPAQDYIWYFDENGFRSEPTKASGVYEPFTLDLNGDGFDDIIWYAPGTAQDYLWYGKAGGGHTSVPTKASGVYEPFVGDFNDDGFDDIFWYAPGTRGDYIWYGKANGHTSVPTRVNGRYRPVSGDFDGDGFGDVLFYAPGTAPDYQWLFKPGGYDDVPVSINGIYEPLAGDFNGDRYDDVFLYGVGARGDYMNLGGENGVFG